MSLGVGGIVSVGGGSSGGGGGSTSGIQVINPGGNTGPTIDFQGVNGINVTSPGPNVVLIDGAGASGTSTVSKYATDFSSITSGTFTHGFNTLDVIVQVYDERRFAVIPDSILVENGDQVSLFFNRPQSGRIVII